MKQFGELFQICLAGKCRKHEPRTNERRFVQFHVEVLGDTVAQPFHFFATLFFCADVYSCERG